MNPKVDDYIAIHTKWQKELKVLRTVLLELALEEDIKWGIPAYIHKRKNILGLSAFKNYCGIWFHHGVFLKDEANILINAQKDKTLGMRQMRFISLDEIDTELVKLYVLEAMSNSEAGKEIKPKRNTKPVVIPEELKIELSKNIQLKYLFNEFSKSKQREFCDYILSAKRDNTKQTRIAKIIPMILNKVGLNDKYRNC
ncbi:MAG: YdeI family protein [Polaribacter sp.]